LLNPVSFSGRDRVEVQRRALDFWYHNRERLGLDLCAFLARCTLSADEKSLTFQTLATGPLAG
jgi:hypothetical protein